MGLVVSYGAFTSDESECAVVETVSLLKTPMGHPYGFAYRWQIDGVRLSDSFTNTVSAMASLQGYFTGGDLTKALRLTDGATGATVAELSPNGSISGVLIEQAPGYPNGGGAQLTTFADYTIVASVEHLSPNAPLYAEFQESISFRGGGPLRDVFDLTNGAPQAQILRKQTAYRAQQSGSAVGLESWPPVPAAKWPTMLTAAPVIQRQSPQLMGVRTLMYSVSWQYDFASPAPLAGNPTLPKHK